MLRRQSGGRAARVLQKEWNIPEASHPRSGRNPAQSGVQSGAPAAGPREAGELVSRIRAGDESAIGELYDRYSCVVYGAALRVLGDTGAAEDVLQDVFMQLWRNPSAFNANRGSLAAWLSVIARNRAIDRLRRRKPETDFEDVALSVDAGLDDAAERARAIEKVRGVLAGIPGEQRAAVEMAFFEGMTHSEIAQKTGQPLGTVKTRIRTALLTLRRALGR
ncbi:MAG TPA: sigma-70 family RNA polymerase sigma factor [Terriglobales bacterium]|nr:sigma-70 family RNA polymerase sigma factor [Terriglobales bacterium]